jgi:hypothetical protein
VFRAYRIPLDDPRIQGKSLGTRRHVKLNRAIAEGVVQREPDFEHYIPPRPEARTVAKAG